MSTDDTEQVIGCAQQLVTQALLEHFLGAKDVNNLTASYMTCGDEVPMIYSELQAAFHAYRCARQRAGEPIRGEKAPVLSCTLVRAS